MKSLSKIIARYLFTAVLILLMTLFFNIFLYPVTAFYVVQPSGNTNYNSAKGLSEELSIIFFQNTKIQELLLQPLLRM